MYPDAFDYERAETVEDALALLAAHADRDVELLAGGHSLVPAMKAGEASPDVVVDVGRAEELSGVERDEGTTTIGATTRYADVLGDDRLRRDAPALVEAVGEVGDLQVRNAGTVGGNLAESDPASDLTGAALAADVTLYVRSQDGTREVPVDDFFRGPRETALADDELLTAVEVPHVGRSDGAAYVRKRDQLSGFALVGVAVRLRTDGDRVESARVAASGAVERATRLVPVEEALEGAALGDDLGDATTRATDGVAGERLVDDVHASAEFRAHLLEEYATRAIERARDRALGGER